MEKEIKTSNLEEEIPLKINPNKIDNKKEEKLVR